MKRPPPRASSLGVDEPYRMFSSRAEYRLHLRADNAVRRLGDMGERLGLISSTQLAQKRALRDAGADENDRFYAGYIARAQREIEGVRRDMGLKIPGDFNYRELPGLTNELIEKLSATRPENIAALSRIPGMTPAGIVVVLRRLRS